MSTVLDDMPPTELLRLIRSNDRRCPMALLLKYERWMENQDVLEDFLDDLAQLSFSSPSLSSSSSSSSSLSLAGSSTSSTASSGSSSTARSTTAHHGVRLPQHLPITTTTATRLKIIELEATFLQRLSPGQQQRLLQALVQHVHGLLLIGRRSLQGEVVFPMPSSVIAEALLGSSSPSLSGMRSLSLEPPMGHALARLTIVGLELPTGRHVQQFASALVTLRHSLQYLDLHDIAVSETVTDHEIPRLPVEEELDTFADPDDVSCSSSSSNINININNIKGCLDPVLLATTQLYNLQSLAICAIPPVSTCQSATYPIRRGKLVGQAALRQMLLYHHNKHDNIHYHHNKHDNIHYHQQGGNEEPATRRFQWVLRGLQLNDDDCRIIAHTLATGTEHETTGSVNKGIGSSKRAHRPPHSHHNSVCCLELQGNPDITDLGCQYLLRILQQNTRFRYLLVEEPAWNDLYAAYGRLNEWGRTQHDLKVPNGALSSCSCWIDWISLVARCQSTLSSSSGSSSPPSSPSSMRFRRKAQPTDKKEETWKLNALWLLLLQQPEYIIQGQVSGREKMPSRR